MEANNNIAFRISEHNVINLVQVLPETNSVGGVFEDLSTSTKTCRVATNHKNHPHLQNAALAGRLGKLGLHQKEELLHEKNHYTQCESNSVFIHGGCEVLDFGCD